MIILLIRRLLLLFLLVCSMQVSAQSSAAPRYFVRQFGAADGLPQPFVYALVQDHAGYLWIGTAEGVVRYDGTEFVAFTTKDGLAEDFVTSFYVHPRTGQLWVGHYQGGVSRWNGQDFQRVTNVASRPPGFRAQSGIPPADTTYANSNSSAASVPAARHFATLHQVLPPGTIPQCVLTDREHNVWIGTAGQGLWRWSDRHVTFFPSSDNSKPTIGALHSGTRTVGALSTGQLFALDPTPNRSSPFIIYPERQLPFAPSVLLQTQHPITHSVSSGHYTSPPETVIWAGTTGHGLWQTQLLKAAPAPTTRPVRRLPATLSVTALTQHPNGDLWVGTALDGVYRLPADSTQSAEHFTTANGLLHNTIYALTTDSLGQVWIGTHDTGLAVWQGKSFRYYRFRSGALDVSSLLTDATGRVWIGTEGSGVFCYENNKLRPYSTTDGLLSPYCYALHSVRWGRNHQGGIRSNSGNEQVLVVHRNGLTFNDKKQHFALAALPGNPLLQDLLPGAAVAWNDYCVWLRTRTGLVCLRTDAPDLLPGASMPTPTLLTSEVDGAAQLPDQLKELSATQHQVNFTFRGVSLLPGQAGLQYQYRLLGYQDQWSRPTVVGEAQFPRLGAGSYTFEVRARLGEQGVWSKPVATSFGVATPFWQTWWFATGSLLLAGVGIFFFIRAREATLRRQKLHLETTVRERTQELRQQKAHIENMNAELVVARDVAEASRRAKAQFLANMSHEIRTPMNAVIGLTHLLRQTPVNSEQNEYLEAVQSSSQNLLVIINDILDSSKIEAGKLSLEHTAFRLPELLRRVASMFQFATEAKHLYFKLEIEPNVPAAVLGDSVRLNQVLVNLVGNAVKFTTKGGVMVRVHSTDAVANKQLVRFTVQDTGIGIPANKLDAIFEDFSQANTSTTRQFGGTGLGLSIARNLVELHGGRLWVESEEGQGSAFSFEIPYQVADPAEVAAEATLAVGRFEPALRVLVAEDNDLNQLVARKTLEAWNVQVTIAANGQLAVEAAEQATFDAVLMDVQMPEMDGYEAARQLRARFPDAAQLPIIGLTASALPEDRVLALEAGMNDTLAKPFDPALLYARLAHYTGRTPLPPQDAPTLIEITVATPPEKTGPDWSLLEELAGGNEAFVHQIVNTFLTQAPHLQQRLEAEFAAADLVALARTAHKLKGQAAYFGVDQLYSALEILEQQARQDTDRDALASLLQLVEGDLQQLYAQLQERLTI